MRENEKYLDSIQGRIDLFTNAVQTMWSNALDTDIIKVFFNVAKSIVQAIDWMNEHFSLLGTTIISLSAAKGIKSLFSAFNIGGKFTSFFDAINGKTMKEAWKNLKNLSSASNEVTASTLALRVETGKMTAMEAVRQAATHQLVLSRISLTDIEAKELLSTIGLTEAEQQAIVTKLGLDATSKRLTLTKLQELVADNKLTTAEALHMATAARLVTTQVSLTAAKATDILTSHGVVETEAEAIVTKLGLGTATKALTTDIILESVASGSLTSAQGSLALSLLATTGATNTLKGAIVGLWTAIWPMLILAAAAAVIYGIVKAIDAAVDTSDELAESIENTRSEIKDIESEIDSLNEQLETVQDRMTELLAMPSLSFTEQEELENLKQQNAELERSLALQEALNAQKNKKLQNDIKTQIGNTWSGTSIGKQDYYIDRNGVISHDSFWKNDKSGKEVLDEAFEKYATLKEKQDELDDLYQKGLEEIASDDKISIGTYGSIQAAKGNIMYGTSLYSSYNDFLSQDSDKYLSEFRTDVIDKNAESLDEISNGIALVFSDMLDMSKGLSRGDDETINEFLDELNYYQLQWQEIQGISARSAAIKSMFDDTQNEATKNIENNLKEIAASDKYADTEEGNAQRIAAATKVVQDALDDTTNTYSRLQNAMSTMKLTAEEVARYFVQLSQAPDSDSVEGIMAQYQKGIDALQKFKEAQNVTYTDLDGTIEEIGFGDLFKLNDDGRYEAIDTQIAKVLQGADETTRKEFANIVESIKNGNGDITEAFDQSIGKFALIGIGQALKLEAKDIEESYSTIFKDIKDDVSGLIDTFSELSAALENTASAMDSLDAAQTQMKNSGQISIKTALDLISKTENWSDVIDISNGKIQLAVGAEDALVQERINLIKVSLENARAQAVNQLAQLNAAKATLYGASADSTNIEAQKNYQHATNQSTAATAAFGAVIGTLADALANADTSSWKGIIKGLSTLGKGSLTSAFTSAYSDAMTSLESDDDDTKNSNLSEAELEKQIKGIDAMLAMVDKVDTAQEFKNNYDYSKTPGDKYDDGADSALEKLKKKYERQISNLNNQQTYLQNEIDILQAKNEGVSKSYYEEQIALEEKKLKLYEQERAELLVLMSNTKQGTDVYNDMADAIWGVEHNIQEATKNLVEFRKEIINLYKEAFDDIKTAYSDKDSFYEDQQTYIDKYNELLGLQGKTGNESSVKKQLAIEEQQMADNIAQLADLKKTRDDALNNDAIEYSPEKWVAMEADIRATEAAILDNQIAIENYKQSLIDLYTEAFSKVNEMFGNKNSFLSSQQSYIEGYADYLEAIGMDVPKELYEELISIEQDKRDTNVENLDAARQSIADLEARFQEQGLSPDLYGTKEEWVEANNKAIELEKSIQDNDIAMAQWNRTVREMDFTKFDTFIDRLVDLESELKNVIGLLYSDKEDIALEDGSWTKEGITTIAMYYQQMEIAKQKSEEYADQIEELNKMYDEGSISEKDYYERLQTLKDGQWDAINSYEDMKDAIVDLNSARIDMIEKGINEEIKAYGELISLKQKELQQERD